MKRRMKILVIVGVVLSLMAAEAYILKRGPKTFNPSSEDATFSLPSALAQTTGSSIILKKASCSTASSSGTHLFTCVADLDGTGQQQVIVGHRNSSLTGASVTVTIINSDGTVRATIPNL